MCLFWILARTWHRAAVVADHPNVEQQGAGPGHESFLGHGRRLALGACRRWIKSTLCTHVLANDSLHGTLVVSRSCTRSHCGSLPLPAQNIRAPGRQACGSASGLRSSPMMARYVSRSARWPQEESKLKAAREGPARRSPCGRGGVVEGKCSSQQQGSCALQAEPNARHFGGFRIAALPRSIPHLSESP